MPLVPCPSGSSWVPISSCGPGGPGRWQWNKPSHSHGDPQSCGMEELGPDKDARLEKQLLCHPIAAFESAPCLNAGGAHGQRFLMCSTACGLVLLRVQAPLTIGSCPVANSCLALPLLMHFRPYMAEPWLPRSCTHRCSQQHLFHHRSWQDVPCSLPRGSSAAGTPRKVWEAPRSPLSILPQALQPP